jgi:hypothetical protein
MHVKEIKSTIRKQLKSEYPNWKRLTRKEKRSIAKKVLDEVVKGYDFEKTIQTPLAELLGIEEQIPTNRIKNIEEMGRYIKMHYSSCLFKLNKKQNDLFKKDEELRFIDDLLDDGIINKLLSYEGYTPSMREFFPCQFLRAELLKAIKYPEISYRKFCSNEYMGMERKLNRLFIGLPLNQNKQINHVQLSQFRASLTFTQMANITVYILRHFFQSGLLSDHILHSIDSTELPIDCQRLLASFTINGQKIRIYDDIDSDCGRRRKKRDKSIYVVGYRLHTLTVIDAKTGYSYPLISLLAPANHHDSKLLAPLVNLGKAIGIDLKLITADQAYNDSDGTFFKETGVHLITPSKSVVSVPENVNTNTNTVTCNDMCTIPMEYVGYEEGYHEYKCGAVSGECPFAHKCPQFRQIPIDGGLFQQIPFDTEHVEKVIDIRKNAERPFNLLKKREGLETTRVRNQHNLLARCTFTGIVTLLLEMSGTRKKKKVRKYRQLELFAA